jgi:hypothetical protein
MQAWQAGRKLERDDRYVRRVRVLSPAAYSRPRITFLVEEGLRLASLLGEDEGRIYYFRRLQLRDLPADATRKVWLDNFQNTLRQLATKAVHGADSRASSAEVVFFHNQEEAWSLLLRRLAHDEGTAAWFWPAVSGTSLVTSRSTQIAAVLERMRGQPSSWRTVSRIIFAPHAEIDPLRLIVMVPPQVAQVWLRELPQTSRHGVTVPHIHLPKHAEIVLLRAVCSLGCDDARTIWLAFLAVTAAQSSFVFDPTIQMLQAKAVLRQVSGGSTLALPSAEKHGVSRLAADFVTLREISFRTIEVPEDQSLPISALSGVVTATENASSGSVALNVRESPAMSPAHSPINGEPTNAAGLFFLLNVLRRIGIIRALESCPELAKSAFVALLLQRLADHALVDQSDPILHWVKEAISEASDVAFLDHSPARLSLSESVCPSNLAPTERDAFENDRLLRTWGVAVRRWCWRAAQITVSEIVNRPGRVSLSQTDLDVTLPLDAVDIQIRRSGLDLDPGWLPWLGRVVRFHYVTRLSGDSEC